jgi:hypothetical protein
VRLTAIYEDLSDDIKNAIGLAYFKKQQDPNHPSKPGTLKALPYRSGSDDPPLKPRHRRFFRAEFGSANAYYGNIDDVPSRRARTNAAGEPQPYLDYPIDKTDDHREVERKARKAFGRQAQAGQQPHEP